MYRLVVTMIPLDGEVNVMIREFPTKQAAEVAGELLMDYVDMTATTIKCSSSMGSSRIKHIDYTVEPVGLYEDKA